MKARICYLKDVLGNRYLGFKFPDYVVEDYVFQWINSYTVSDNEVVEELMFNRQKRDGEHYHCTLVNVMDFNKLQDCEHLIGTEFSFDVLGVGKAEDKGNEAHFIVLECNKLQTLRQELGLKEHNLHITIGFNQKDVFTKPKDRTSIYIPFN